ncbi:MAG: RND transporter, partial [Paraburkholderia terricola]
QVLQTQLQASHLSGTQAVATVNLIRALGGGWSDVKAPDAAVGSVTPASGAVAAATSASAPAVTEQVAKR